MEFLKYAFMQKALAAGALISLLTGLASFFITSKNLSFLGEGISHIAFGGLALAVLLGFNPFLGAFLFALAAGLAIARINLANRISEDTAIGILVSFSMALGIVLISLKKGYTNDLLSFLFGSILTVTSLDIFIMLGLILVLGPFFYFTFDKFLLLLFDREYGRIIKVPVHFYYYVLILSIVAAILSLIKITGVILVTGLLVLPGASSYLIARNYKQQILFSILISFVSIISGLIMAFYINWPAGATIVINSTLLFILLGLYRKIRALF